MSIMLDNDVDWIFMFCNKCWDYKKFVFDQPLNLVKDDEQISGQCVTCKNLQSINRKEVREYYDHLNDHNQ